MIINITINTDSEDVLVSVSKGFNTLRILNLMNIFFIRYIKRNVPKFKKEIDKKVI